MTVQRSDFLHLEFEGGPDDAVEVTLDRAANVQPLDPANFQNYRSGRAFRYFGGYVTQSPYMVRPPHYGHWHVAVDLGGNAGAVRAGIRVISPAHG